MKSFNALAVTAAAGLGCLAGALAFGQPEKAKPVLAPEMKLPKGWTPEDMQACMMAGVPGKQHQFLARQVGSWHGKQKMWMTPDSEAMASECTTTLSTIMDGRFTKLETTGEIPGMGPFNGFAIAGYDNVSQKFVSSWIDNHGTGIMQGTGELSADGKTLTWTYAFNCPLTKKPAVMREVETFVSDSKMTLEMFTNDPKSGKEYKMMHVEYTK